MNLVQTIIPYHANILQMLMWNQWKTLKIPWNFLLLNGCGWTYMILTYVTLLANSFRLTANPPANPTCCLVPSIHHLFPLRRVSLDELKTRLAEANWKEVPSDGAWIRGGVVQWFWVMLRGFQGDLKDCDIFWDWWFGTWILWFSIYWE